MKIAKKIIFLCTGNLCRIKTDEGFDIVFSKIRLEIAYCQCYKKVSF